MSALNVWMNGELVGCWEITRAGLHRLSYEMAEHIFKETRAQARKFLHGPDT